MSVGYKAVNAGLVFVEPRTIDIVAAGNRARSTLHAFEGSPSETHVISDEQVVVQSANYEVVLKAQEYPDLNGLEEKASYFLEATISATRNCQQSMARVMESALAHILVSLQRTLKAEHVQWLAPGIMLSKHEFAEATMQSTANSTADLAPRTRQRKPLPAIEETNELLLNRLSQKDIVHTCPSIISVRKKAIAEKVAIQKRRRLELEEIREKTFLRRLSVWVLTLAIILVYMPVGVSLVVFNLLRGENLRLSSQVTALTGTFFGLQALGTTAEAMSAIKLLIQ